MDCHKFDGQVVRLERLKESADQFVRVRLTRIDELDLNLFEFDYDLTFVAFFLDGEGRVYSRYGGRDAESPDGRQSLDGLNYTMQSVLRMHARESKTFAPKSQESPKFVRDVAGGRGGRDCMHCHQVKEAVESRLQRAGKWERDLIWRYPPPENIGLELEVDRGDTVKAVRAVSPAADAGLRAGDVLRRLNGVPVHSMADVQFGLDRAPASGSVEVVWQSGDEVKQGKLSLPQGWRRTDISWRASRRSLVPSTRLTGAGLTAEEKKALGLSATRLAFRQRESVSAQARAAGVRAGDVILGVDGKTLEMDLDGFYRYVQSNYLVGDTVTVNVLRDGKPLNLTMTLLR